MKVNELLNYIQQPHHIPEKQVEAVKKLANDFPYFQAGQILLSLAAKKWDAALYQHSLKKTAISVPNRAHLFELIHKLEQSSFEADEKPTSIPLEIKDELTSQKELVSESAKEDVLQEINLLKAAEVSTEQERQTPAEEKNKAEEQLEKEIARQVVTAFVEKEIIKTPEANEPVTKPESPESFGDWLSFLKKNNGQPYHEIKEKVNEQKARQAKDTQVKGEENQLQLRKKKNMAIIDKIIENNPGHIRVKEDQKFFSPEQKAKESLAESEHLVTETLAKIYALQGNISKAIRAYEILSIRHPQKSAYYATLIQKLKNP